MGSGVGGAQTKNHVHTKSDLCSFEIYVEIRCVFSYVFNTTCLYCFRKVDCFLHVTNNFTVFHFGMPLFFFCGFVLKLHRSMILCLHMFFGEAERLAFRIVSDDILASQEHQGVQNLSS